MRWRIHLCYLGTAYCGWQRQDNGISVQQVLEEAFALILQQPVELTGCGRTDTGVHARYYVAHMDVKDASLSEKLVYQVNAVLPDDISVHHIEQAEPSFHARFDAIQRQYKYYVHFEKDPFSRDQSFYFQRNTILDTGRMQDVAELLKKYKHFKPFCKSGSDAEHYLCDITESSWYFERDRAVFTIASNRFLRGMVRLVVGACLNAGMHKISVGEVQKCLDEQSILPHAWSVPPEGLFLEDVRY